MAQKTRLRRVLLYFHLAMHGVLPPPVEKMLEKKHGVYENERYDFIYDGAHGDAEKFLDENGF